MLAKSKLNNIAILISQALIDPEISDEEFKIIVNEKAKKKKMEESKVITTKISEKILEMQRIKKRIRFFNV